ncbi:MAG TPA: leukotriene A4 hydrolase C-terminal domain-containing protein [Anaerolineales bacterium]|nr:leukotriene A4 hydrolase C-terminal domain-containing protein [Anaerolineales bacterium]
MTFHDPTSYTDLTQGRIEHIDFHIRVDFESCTLDVEARYQMQEPVHGSLYLDTYKLELQEARIDHRDLEWEFDTRDETLGERLHLKGLAGASSFILKFRTSPEARALQWMSPTQTAGGTHPFLYSQCQASNARSVFPCQDTPSVRFTYTAEVQEMPEGLTAVMAAERVEAAEGSGKFSFRMPQPIPSYLFALAVANLDFRELGPRTGIYAEPDLLDAAAWEFAETEKTMVEAEKLLGPYLWGRYDMLVLPPSFPFGGMENPRLTFLTPTAILGTRGQANLVTHELAHAWTGNLVTNATWQDFWLNEGWTTYAETRITEILEGKESADLNAVYDEKRTYAIMERVGMDSPLTCLKQPQDGRDADSMTSVLAYTKGCFFLKECEYAVGRERFDAFIQKYMKRFQFQSLTTEEFLGFLKAELPEVLEKVDVESWIYKPGMPDSWHKPQSTLYDEVEKALRDFGEGRLPAREQIKDWRRYQMLSFLQGMPPSIPVEACRQLDEVLELEKRNDDHFLSYFYATCIASGYREILPRVETFVEKIGRMLYIIPIGRALVASDWARDRARPLFERVRERHHPVTINAVDGFLKKAGL